MMGVGDESLDSHTLWAIILMGLASNLDNLGVGVAYGLRGIQVPSLSNSLMALVTGVTTLLAMVGGDWLSQVMGGHVARYAGIALMAAMGLWISLKALTENQANRLKSESQQVWRFRLKGLGLVICVLHEPSRADADRSGTLDPGEAIILGISLALNCLAGGLSVGLLQFPAVLTSLVVGAGSYISFALGMTMGRAIGSERLGVWAGLGSGVLMIVLAWWQTY